MLDQAQLDKLNSIFDILVNMAKAPENIRDSFINRQTSSDEYFKREFRFIGTLGLGGKLHSRDPKAFRFPGEQVWWVTQYPQDQTEESKKLIEQINLQLKKFE